MCHVPFSCFGVQGTSDLRKPPVAMALFPRGLSRAVSWVHAVGTRCNRITRRCPEQSTSYGRGQAAEAWCSVCGGDQGSGRGRGVLCDPRRVS